MHKRRAIKTKTDRILIKKELTEIWNDRVARSCMIIIPIFLALLIPGGYLAMLMIFHQHNPLGDGLMALLTTKNEWMNERQALFAIFSRYICPMLFLMIPLLCSCITAASSFVGERDRQTLESLLLTPVRTSRVFQIKAICCIMISAVTTAISFALMTLVLSIGDILLKVPFFFRLEWLIVLVLLAPSITVLGTLFTAAGFFKSGSYLESIQTSAYLAFPLTLCCIVPFTGLLVFSAHVLLIFWGVIVLADVILWGINRRSFQMRKIAL